jgi:hypothetical protein
MKQSICVEPKGIQLHKFKAEVDVIAENVRTGNILIKSFPNTFKELKFSIDDSCWKIIAESNDLPPFEAESEWKRIVRGLKDETDFCTTIPIEAKVPGVVGD